MPSPSRFCSSVLFQTERLNFLLDCGEGTSSSLLRNKIDPELIDSIFISHSHVDHLGGLFLLVQMMHLLQRRIPLDIYLPEEAVSGVKDFLNTCYLFPEKIVPKLNLHPVRPNFTFQDGEIKIKAYPNRHLLGNREIIDELKFPNKMQSFCFLLDIFNKKILYSGDIESSDDLTDIIQDTDLLITECFHPKLKRLIPLLIRKRVKSAILTHIPPELEEKEEEIIENAQKLGFKKLWVAYDGLSIDI